jgi:hypothetical protein
VIRTKPNPAYEAGDRTGRLPEVFPLDFDAFGKAFATGATAPAAANIPATSGKDKKP